MPEKSLKDLTSAVYKIAENSPKIQKDVKDIRDAIVGTDGLVESVKQLTKKLDDMQKKGTLSKITGKSGNRYDRRIIKSTSSIEKTLNKILDAVSKNDGRRLHADNFTRNNSRVSGGNDLSSFIDVVDKLKNIKLKDFILAKIKIKHLGKIMRSSLNLFRSFNEKNKEAEKTISFTNSSIEMMEKLAKVNKVSLAAKRGEKTMENLFLGDGKKRKGLLGLFRKINIHKKEIDQSRKSLNDIRKSCGSFLLTSMVLVGIAALSIPAMLGALLMKGVVWLLIGTFKLLSKSRRTVSKGSLVLLLMSTSIIAFGLGLGLMVKAVKDMKLKDVGLMMASIAGVGVAVAGIGLLSIPIALGSTAMILLSASLGILGLALNYWKTFDASKSMDNVKSAIGGLRDVFGLELGKGDEKKSFGQRLKGGLMDIAMSVLNFGSTFFIMGSLLLAGAALGVLKKGLKSWDNFDGKKSADNIKKCIGTLREVFGLEDRKDESIKSNLKGLGKDLIGLGSSFLQMGSTFAKMGSLVFATAMMDIIRVTLIPWQKYDARAAAGNMKTAIGALSDTFGLEDRKGESVSAKAKGGLNDLIGLASSIFQMGSTFAKMGTLVFATAMMDVIRLTLIPWEKYDPSKAVGNMRTAVIGLEEMFGLQSSQNKTIGEGIVGGITDLLSLGSGLLKMGDTMVKMGTLLIATGAMEKIKENLNTWENYNPDNSISNIRKAISGLTDVFGLHKEVEEKTDGGFLGKVGNFFKKAADVVTTPVRMVGNLVSAAEGLTEGGKTFAKLSSLVTGSASMLSIKSAIEPWNDFDSSKSITNIKNAINGLAIGFGVNNVGYLSSISSPLKNTISSINKLDLDKASTMIDLFKSFKYIGIKPFDKFTVAVEKFSESCRELIISLNDFNKSSQSNSNVESTSIESTNSNNTSIANTQELAEAIAYAIKNLNVNVRTDISDVRLVVNNESGRRVVLTLDN